MNEIKLMDVYTAMLQTTAMEVTSDGFVRMSIGDGEYLPVVGKEGKSVVLPLTERLLDPNNHNYEVFHLLAENSKVSNSSDLLTRYRHWLINRENIVIGSLGTALLRIAADAALSKRLRPDQADFLKLVVGADETSAIAFGKIADAASKPNQLQRVFASMYIRNAGVLDNKSYGRIATVNFPFYDELKKIDDEAAEAKKAPKGQKKQKVENVVFDVEMRIKDRAVFMGLMHYLIPNLDVEHAYDVGSNSKIAPSIDALMRAFHPMAKHLNDIMEVFKGLDPAMDRALDNMYFNLDWFDAFINLDALWNQIRMVPQQNQGVINEPTETAPTPAGPAPAPLAPPPWNTAPQAVYSAPTQAYPAPAQPQGMYPPPAVPAQRSSGSGVSVAAMMHRSMAGQRQQPGGYPQGPMHQTQYPGMYPQQPMQSYPQSNVPAGMPNYAGGRRY
jgi:hypothetical protein